jgi:hypothetical protein
MERARMRTSEVPSTATSGRAVTALHLSQLLPRGAGSAIAASQEV